jgi:hypothetical protein
VSLRLLITHSGGAELECCSVLSRQGKMQEMGSQITYMRRYMYQAAVGVVAEEDDDGNAGDGNQRDVQSRQRPPSPPKPPVKARVVESVPVAAPVPSQAAVAAPAGPSPAGGSDVKRYGSEANKNGTTQDAGDWVEPTRPIILPKQSDPMSDEQRKEVTALFHSKAWPGSDGKPFVENGKDGKKRWAPFTKTRCDELCSKVLGEGKTHADLKTQSQAWALLTHLRDFKDIPEQAP